MKDFIFKPMTIDLVKEIETWRYSGFMKEIYMKPYYDNYDPTKDFVKGPANCDGFVVYKESDIIGLFEYYVTDNRMEIGLALHPKHIGKGMSTMFINAGIEFIEEYYHRTYNPIWLSVEKENRSAYYAYIKAGFMVDHETEEEYVMKKQIRA